MSDDPFGIEHLREAALQAWRSSPTRFREDANAEEDLVLGGYRDRWFVELAQNAADAAARAGVPGELRLCVERDELRVANTGEPLDAAGVAALASLRASAKRDTASVGRFGVGFAAVLAVSAEPRVISTTGGVRFSARQTGLIVDGEPRLRDEVRRRGGRVPVLRLVWPADPAERPPDGFDTEVRLPLLPGIVADALLAEAAEQASDLLLALPALHRIDVGGRVYRREDAGEHTAVLTGPGGSTRWRLVRRAGELPLELLTAAEERSRWSVCWAVPEGVPRPDGEDVLHAPTPTDERLSLPARLLATVPMEPSRRRVRYGASADFVLARAVEAYPELVMTVPPEHRTTLVPAAGFPRSEVDAVLRDGVIAALRATAWLPAADGGTVSPAIVRVLDRPAPRLVELLAGVVPGLGAAALSEPARVAAMTVLGVPRLGLADIVAAVSGVHRAPAWWRELYDALAPVVDADPAAREELAALPVPLADGRTVTGPRTTIIAEWPAPTVDDRAVVRAGTMMALPAELRAVHPDAVHPLLVRLGARPAGPGELLDSPALREAVERSVDDAEAGLDTAPLADAVLRLVAAGGSGWTVHAPGTTTMTEWLGALALPDETGEPRRADELMLPDGALRAVLAPDAPIGVLHPDIAREHGRETLRAVGVLDGFAVLVDEHPTAPDHDLADEDAWWASLAEPPQRLVAARDLDLVDDAAWPLALRLLAKEPDTWQALHGEYTRWWLARHARLAGHPPRHWRLAAATALTGLYDTLPGVDLDDGLLALAGVRTELTVADEEDAADLLARLGDARREPSPATVRSAHAALAGAPAFDLEALDPPATVRAVSGATADAGRAYVLDLPWLAGIADPDRAVAGGDPYLLAELLDLSLASEELGAEVVSTGREVPWQALPEVAAAAEALGREVPPGTVILHEELRVRDRDGAEHAVPFWVEQDTVHAADPLRALVWHDRNHGSNRDGAHGAAQPR